MYFVVNLIVYDNIDTSPVISGKHELNPLLNNKLISKCVWITRNWLETSGCNCNAKFEYGCLHDFIFMYFVFIHVDIYKLSSSPSLRDSGISHPFRIRVWSCAMLLAGCGTNGSDPTNMANKHTPLQHKQKQYCCAAYKVD